MGPMKAKRKRWGWRRAISLGTLGAVLMIPGPSRLQADTLDADPAALEDEELDPDEPTIEESLMMVDDAEIKSVFQEGLAKLLEDSKTGDPKDLRLQLETKSRCQVELPPPSVSFPIQPEDVYRASREGVLCLGCIYKCDKCEHWHPHLAGGVLLTEDGVAVTNYHVMAREDAAAYGALSDDGQVFPITKVLAASKEDDLAIVQLDVEAAVKPKKLIGARGPVNPDTAGGAVELDDELTPAILSVDDQVGSPVWAITHPTGRFYTLTTGVISRYYRRAAKNGGVGPLRVAITADYARGSSGCGIFNSFGKLTALASSTKSVHYSQEDGEGRNLQMVFKECIPARRIMALIEKPTGDE